MWPTDLSFGGEMIYDCKHVFLSEIFSRKLTHPHMFSIRLVQNCAAITATAELLSVASLGLVSPGAATDGVTPISSPQQMATFFSHHSKMMTFFNCRLVVTPIFRHRVVQCSL